MVRSTRSKGKCLQVLNDLDVLCGIKESRWQEETNSWWILEYEPTESPTGSEHEEVKILDGERTKLNVNAEDEDYIYRSKESGAREETELKNVNVVEDEHFISRSKESGPREEETKLKSVNVVDNEHFISTSEEKQIVKYEPPIERSTGSKCISFGEAKIVDGERTKLKNANVVEDEHFTSKSKGKQILRRPTSSKAWRNKESRLQKEKSYWGGLQFEGQSLTVEEYHRRRKLLYENIFGDQLASKGKANGETQKPESKNENVSSSGRR